jgi:hypothetical protein
VQPPSSDPIVVTIVQTPAKETTILDVVVGSLGLAGALFGLALVLGLVLSLVRLSWTRRHPPEREHMPPVAPPL